MKEIIFGAAYYREYMPCERLEQDIALMKRAGINTVRIAESTWSTLEKTEGNYDFSVIDTVLDRMEANEMKVIIGTPTYAIPSWLAKKDSAVLAETKNGKEQYGRRQNMDITNRTFLSYAERIIRVLMQHVCNRSCVIGFQIDNETKHYGTLGEGVQQSFKEHLIAKFGTVEELNRAYGLAYWSNSIGSWEDFADIRGSIHAGLACEFEKFQRSLVTKYLKWQADIVREYKRDDQFITHNLDFEWHKFGPANSQEGYSYGVQPDANHFQIAQNLTIAGTDIYHMTQDALTGAEIAFCGDLIRSLKKNNYLVLETQAQAFKYWTPYPGQLRLQAYSHLASGANGVMYWNWHSIHNSFETYWKGLLSHDLEPNPTYEEACIIGDELRQIGNQLIHLKKRNQVAMMVSNEALTALKWFMIDENLTYNNVVRWMYDALYEMNVECDIICSEETRLEEYQVLIIPAMYTAPRKLLEKINTFVKKGGTVIASFKTAFSDENLSVYTDKQPCILTECMGISYNQFTHPNDVTLRYNKDKQEEIDEQDKLDEKDKEVSYWMELLTTDTAQTIAYYHHKYWSNYSAITKNQFGEGFGYYIGCFCSSNALRRIYKMALNEAGLKNELVEEQWPVVRRKGRNQYQQEVSYYFNYSKNDQTFLCPSGEWMELLSKEGYKEGSKILLKDWGVKILCKLS